MTVKELKERLSKYDENLEVISAKNIEDIQENLFRKILKTEIAEIKSNGKLTQIALISDLME